MGNRRPHLLGLNNNVSRNSLGPGLNNHLPFSWPCERFLDSPLGLSLLSAQTREALDQHCSNLDRNFLKPQGRSFVGLEIDPRHKGKADCYFSGNKNLLNIIEKQENSWVNQAQITTFIEKCQKRLSPSIHLEYDLSPNGYQLAGLSQRFAFDQRSPAEVEHTIQHFITALGSLMNGNPSPSVCRQPALQAIIHQIGLPIHVAMMGGHRDRCLKIITPINRTQLKKLQRFLSDDQHGYKLRHALNNWPLIEQCVERTAPGTCKLSFDLNLETRALDGRLGLEIAPIKPMQRRDMWHRNGVARVLSGCEHSLTGYSDTIGLLDQTPFGEKHPFNATDLNQTTHPTYSTRLFFVVCSHIKICLTSQERWIKTYLGLCQVYM